jgi:hypothetical protein
VPQKPQATQPHRVTLVSILWFLRDVEGHRTGSPVSVPLLRDGTGVERPHEGWLSGWVTAPPADR